MTAPVCQPMEGHEQDQQPAAPVGPFWTVEVTLDIEADYRRVYDAVEKLLHDLGQIGSLSGQKWDPVP